MMSSTVLNKVSGSLLKILFPDLDICVYCGSEYRVQNGACPNCAATLSRLKYGRGSALGFKHYAVFRYDDIVSTLIKQYKYDNRRYISEYIAEEMNRAMENGAVKGDILVHIPLHERKKRKRGFCQAERIASPLAEHSGLPHVSALKRVRDTKTQTRLTEKQRIQNVKDAFTVVDEVGIAGKDIILVDDVLTTGATAAECARILKKNGAGSVVIFIFAKT